MARETATEACEDGTQRVEKLHQAVAAFCETWFVEEGAHSKAAVKTGTGDHDCWARVEVPAGVFISIAYGPTERQALAILLRQIAADIHQEAISDEHCR